MLDFLIDFGFPEAELTHALRMLAVYSAVSAVVWLVLYVFQGIAAYKMSVSVGLKRPCFAFIPILREFNLGKIAEKRERANKKPQEFGFYLLLLAVAAALSAIGFLYFSAAAGVKIYGVALLAVENGEEILPEQFISLVPAIVFYVLLFLFSLAEKIVYYIVLYNIFSVFNSKKAVVYTVFSVIFGFTAPLLLFAVRRREPRLQSEELHFSGSFE